MRQAENVDSKKSRSRLDLAEQFRDYQIRSKNAWETASFYASTSNINPPLSHSSSSRCLGAVLLVAVTMVSLLYLSYSRLAFSFMCVAAFLWLVYLRIANKGKVLKDVDFVFDESKLKTKRRRQCWLHYSRRRIRQGTIFEANHVFVFNFDKQYSLNT